MNDIVELEKVRIYLSKAYDLLYELCEEEDNYSDIMETVSSAIDEVSEKINELWGVSWKNILLWKNLFTTTA